MNATNVLPYAVKIFDYWQNYFLTLNYFHLYNYINESNLMLKNNFKIDYFDFNKKKKKGFV
jgi:hypothetical protein